MKSFSPVSVVLCCALAILLTAGVVWGVLIHAQPASLHPDFEVQVSGHGQAVIFIPGIATPGSVWQPSVDDLGAGYQCHLITFAGSGDVPPTDTNPFLSNVRNEIITYIRENKLVHPVIVGHSLGGVMALWIAVTAPELPGKLLIVDALPFAAANRDASITPENARQRIAPLAARYRAASQEEVEKLQGEILPSMITSPEAVRHQVEINGRSDAHTIARSLIEVIGLDLRADLGRITCPVLVLGALQEKVGFPTREAAADNIRDQYAALPHVRFTMFEHSRHFIMIDDFPGYQAALRSELGPPDER